MLHASRITLSMRPEQSGPPELPQRPAAETTGVTCCRYCSERLLQRLLPSAGRVTTLAQAFYFCDRLSAGTATGACAVLIGSRLAGVCELAQGRTDLTLRPSARSLGSSLKRSTILPEAAIMASSSLMLLPKRLLAMSSSKPLHRYCTLLMSVLLVTALRICFARL